MKKLFMGMCLVLALTLSVSCTNPNSATRVLEAQGYSQVQMTGYNFFSCSESDFYHTGFKGLSINGTPVEGTVCEGIFFKNSTVRLK